MKLSKENIQFIDTYLKNSGVFYFDIRMEMLDHIATAVEDKMETEDLDFYDAFKGYMVVNKSEILKGNKEFSMFTKEAIIHFLKFSFHPIFMLLGFGMYFLFDSIDFSKSFSKSFTINNLYFVFIIGIAIFQIFYFYIFKKKRYYAIEKVGGILALINYLQIFFFNAFEKETPSVFTITIFFYFLMVYMVYFVFEMVKFNTFKTKLYS